MSLGEVFWVYYKQPHGVFNISLNFSYRTLLDDFRQVTGLNLWTEVETLVTREIPGAEVSLIRGYGYDCDVRGESFINIEPGVHMTQVQQLSYIEKIELLLEKEAKNRWLRPGVPSLCMLVKNRLKTKEYLMHSIMTHQQQHGYRSTQLLVEQHKNDLL